MPRRRVRQVRALFLLAVSGGTLGKDNMPKKRKKQARKKQPAKKARPIRHRTEMGDPLTEQAVKEDIERLIPDAPAQQAEPQDEIHVDPPFDGNDPDDPVAFLERFIQHMADLEQQFALALKRRLEAAGFTEVEMSCGGTQWEFRASKIGKPACQTADQVRAAVAEGLRELGHEVDGDLIVAVVVGEQVGAAFRLRRLVEA